jgi:multidrug resistance efflux pump
MPSKDIIPIPPGQRWRDIRLTVLPPLTFFLLVVTIFWMWRNYVHPPALVGEVEPVRVNVISIYPGAVLELKVDYLQSVTNGQPLAIVSTYEPDALQSQLESLKAEMELTKEGMTLNVDRDALSYVQMRTQWLNEKAQLSIDQTNLVLAEIEFNRAEQLYQSKTLISEQAMALARTKRDVLRVTVSAKTELVADMEKMLSAHDPMMMPGKDNPAIAAAVQSYHARMTLLQEPLVLKAPMDGFVSAIDKRPGEKVTAGLPILVISRSKSDRIIGWVRQPVLVPPSVGDTVEVRCRRLGMVGRIILGSVIAVGKQVEPITPSALPYYNQAPAARVEFGLQFLVAVPAGSGLIPGETVELNLGDKPSQTDSK